MHVSITRPMAVMGEGGQSLWALATYGHHDYSGLFLTYSAVFGGIIVPHHS